jgi:hypothetical protein
VQQTPVKSYVEVGDIKLQVKVSADTFHGVSVDKSLGNGEVNGDFIRCKD